MSSSRMTVRFYGTRGSHAATGPNYSKYGGNTSCLRVEAAGRTIILDCGTGVIRMGGELLGAAKGAPVVATLILSHYHHDHLAGFGYFAPLFVPTARFTLIGPRQAGMDIEEILTAYLSQPFSPIQLDDMGSSKTFLTAGERHQIWFLEGEEKPVVVDMTEPAERRPDESKVEVRVRCMQGLGHPRNGVQCYRVEHGGRSLVYATDTEGFQGGDQKLVRFAKGADMLVHDAMYTEEKYTTAFVPPQGWGHSTPDMAIDVARQAEVGKLVLFHHDPVNDDKVCAAMERAAKKALPGVVSAREDMELVV